MDAKSSPVYGGRSMDYYYADITKMSKYVLTKNISDVW